jgi:uncharacterized protein (DUF2147 family)
MKTAWILAAAVFVSSLQTPTAWAAEPIVGNWKTQSGETAVIVPCGNSFCITLKTGKHAGKKIGTLSGTGTSYSGEITDPANDKVYSGSGTIAGSQMKMKGCVMNVLCKSQTWTRL